MQRLYSTFPNSWPGLALLLLRLGQGVSVIWESDLASWNSIGIGLVLLQSSELLTGALLVAGLWTPVAGLLQALLECSRIYATSHFSPDHFLSALLGVSLGMLGPGAWSVDAHLFGRQRIRIEKFEE